MNWNNLFSECNEHVQCQFVWRQSSQTFQKGPNLKQPSAPKMKIRLCLFATTER